MLTAVDYFLQKYFALRICPALCDGQMNAQFIYKKRANVESSQEMIRQIALNDELRSNIGLFLRQGIPIS